MKIALVGYGKMGQMIEQIALHRGHEIVSVIDIDNPEDFHSPAFRSADVAIEFTAPTVAYDNVKQCFAAGRKVVSGSTGWLAQHSEEMQQLCTAEGHTLLWSSNFSVGVALFSAINKYLAKLMDAYTDYDVSLTETHHTHKLDAPSGTAITLAEDILANLTRKDTWVKETAVSPAQLPIHSLREGEVPGIHTIIYESPADRILLTHDAKNRTGFALGAVLAAEYVHTHQGFLTIDDLFPF